MFNVHFWIWVALMIVSIQSVRSNIDCGQNPMTVNPGTASIIGGTLAAAGDWPWMTVVLDTIGNRICGGTLINNEYVLTAAHCIAQNLSLTVLLFGDNQLTSLGPNIQIRVLDEAIIHPNYGSVTLQSADLALIKMDPPVQFTSFVRPICLPHEGFYFPPVDTHCYIKGYGRTVGTIAQASSVLQQAAVGILSSEDCENIYKIIDVDNSICAGDIDGSPTSCNGDSGGPLSCDSNQNFWVLAGVTSFGTKTCTTSAVYGKVSNYIDWISEVVNGPLPILSPPKSSNTLTMQVIGGSTEFTCVMPSHYPTGKIVWRVDGAVVTAVGDLVLNETTEDFSLKTIRSLLEISTAFSTVSCSPEWNSQEYTALRADYSNQAALAPTSVNILRVEKVVVKKEEEIKATCTIARHSPLGVPIWRIGDQLMHGSVDDVKTDNEIVSDLTVVALPEYNNQMLTCTLKILSMEYSNMRASAQLTVLYPPILIQTAFLPFIVNEGSDIVFQCVARPGNPHTITWTLYYTNHYLELFAVDASTRIVGNTLNVTIYNTEYRTTGNYICNASNSEGSSLGQQFLRVAYAPIDITQDSQKQMVVNLNENVQMMLLVRSFPALINGSVSVVMNQLDVSSRFQSSVYENPQDEYNIVLAFSITAQEHDGMYIVVVNNGFATTPISLIITVNGSDETGDETDEHAQTTSGTNGITYPPTTAPPITTPPTNSPPTISPPTNSPPTISPPTNSPPTNSPPTISPEDIPTTPQPAVAIPIPNNPIPAVTRTPSITPIVDTEMSSATEFVDSDANSTESSNEEAIGQATDENNGAPTWAIILILVTLSLFVLLLFVAVGLQLCGKRNDDAGDVEQQAAGDWEEGRVTALDETGALLEDTPEDQVSDLMSQDSALSGASGASITTRKSDNTSASNRSGGSFQTIDTDDSDKSIGSVGTEASGQSMDSVNTDESRNSMASVDTGDTDKSVGSVDTEGSGQSIGSIVTDVLGRSVELFSGHDSRKKSKYSKRSHNSKKSTQL